MENPIKMDDLGVPLFLETPISLLRAYFPILTACYCIYLGKPPESHGVFQPSTEKQREGTVDGRNPKQPPGMYKTL